MGTLYLTNEVSFQNFQHLEVCVIPERSTVWIYLNSRPRPSITLTLLHELKIFQDMLINYKGKLPHQGKLVDINYHVVTSRHPVFSFGGDLEYFLECIEKRDAVALKKYAVGCIDTMYPNLRGFDLGITTISLIHGNALGGGFEAALSSHILVAERRAEMGLPEILFNLFPGMGAYQLLSRRTNPGTAEKMMLSGRLYCAEELYHMGVIDILAEDGEGEATINAFIDSNRHRQNGYQAIRKVSHCVNPIDYQQLITVCDIWVEAAMKLTEKDRRTMARLVRGQQKYNAGVTAVPVTQVTAS
jgi:DSF synthase